jgi:hypothetical protein
MLWREIIREPFFSRIWLGAWAGFRVAMVFAGLATVAYLFRGDGPFEQLGLSLQTIVVFYAVSGSLSGGVVGAFLPWARSLPVRMFLGFVAALPVALAAGLTFPPASLGTPELVHWPHWPSARNKEAGRAINSSRVPEHEVSHAGTWILPGG